MHRLIPPINEREKNEEITGIVETRKPTEKSDDPLAYSIGSFGIALPYRSATIWLIAKVLFRSSHPTVLSSKR